MPTLSTCIRKAGKTLNRVDADIINEVQQEYIQDGLGATEAATRAIDDHLAILNEDRDEIIQQAKAAGADVSALTGETRLPSRRGRVEPFKREKKTGRYIGSPQNLRNFQAIVALEGRLRKLANQGVIGRYWYEESSEAILDAVGGDLASAEQMAGLLAIYSSQMEIKGNLTIALKAWNQFRATGAITEIKTGEQDAKADRFMRDGFLGDGEKRNNFRINLMRRFLNDPDYMRDEQGVTADLWMARAFGYDVDAPGGAQYRFIENMTNRIARDLGWEPQQVQAAMWVAAKARWTTVKKEVETASRKKGWIVGTGKNRIFVEREKHRAALFKRSFKKAVDVTPEGWTKANTNFSTAMFNNLAQVSWESRPGTTAFANLIPEIHKAPIEQLIEFHEAISRALTDDHGTDLLARMLGLLRNGAIDGPAAWDFEISWGSQNNVLAPAVDSKTTEVQAEARQLINAYADIMGILLNQDAVAWHRPFWGTSKETSNGVHMEFQRGYGAQAVRWRQPSPLTKDEFNAVYKAVAELVQKPEYGLTKKQAKDFAPIATTNGFRMLNFTEFDKGLPTLSNKDFHAIVTKAVEESLPNDLTVDQRLFLSDGELRKKVDDDGKSYEQRVTDAGFGDTLRWAESILAPRIREVYRDFASRNGWTLPDINRRSLRKPGGQTLPQVVTGRDGRIDKPPVRDDGRVALTHYSRHTSLTTIDPAFYGAASAGDEAARKRDYPEYWVDRAYYGLGVGQIKGYAKERMLGSETYTASLAPEELYDFLKDPDKLHVRAFDHVHTTRGFAEKTGIIPDKELQTAYEQLISENYKGYWVADSNHGPVAAVFEALPVENHVPVLPSNDPGQRYSLRRDQLNDVNADPTSSKSILLKLGVTVEEHMRYPKPMRDVMEEIKARITDLADQTSARRIALGATPHMRLPEFVREMKTPQKVIDMTLHMDGFESELTGDITEKIDPWLKLRRKNRQAAVEMEELMGYTTLWGMDPSKAYEQELTPNQQQEYARLQTDVAEQKMTAQKRIQLNHLEELRRREPLRNKRWTVVKESWDGLPPEAQEIYQSVRDVNAESYKKLVDAINQRIKDLIPEGRTRKIALDEIRKTFEMGRVRGPFFALSRFGDFWGVVKEQLGPDQADVITFTKFPKRSDRDAWYALMQQEFKDSRYTVARGEDMFSFADQQSVNPQFAKKVIAKVSALGEEGQKLSDEIWQMYLRSLPEQSARKHGMHRKGVAGFGEDALRSFAHHSFHNSKQIAKVTYGHKIDSLFMEMEKETRGLASNPWAMALYQEMKDRHNRNMSPNVNPISVKLTSFGAHWFLGFLNPSSAGVNLTQNALFGVAWLSAEHSVLGEGKATKLTGSGAMIQASRDAIATYETMISPEYERLTKEEKDAFKILSKRGVFEKTRAYDLTGMAEQGEDYVHWMRQSGAVSMWLFHHTEQYNRHAAALAAYRLSRDRGDTIEQATKYAEDSTYAIHFNYSDKMRARFTQGNVTRPAFLFRNYSLNAAARLIRDALDSTDLIGSNQTAQVKKIARKRLGRMMVATILMAGVRGLPIWGMVELFTMVFSGDDEFPDPKEQVRDVIAQFTGSNKVANFVMNGPLDYFTGIEVSSRVGLDNLFVRPPSQRDAMETFGGDWWTYYVGEAFGPLAGFAEDVIYAADTLLGREEYQRAFETVAPRSISNISKANRYATEGVMTLGGDEVLSVDELSTSDIVKRAFGVQPTKIGLKWQRNAAIKYQQAMRSAREQDLRDKVFTALSRDDDDRAEEIYEEIREFKIAQPSTSLTPGSAKRSWQSRKRAGKHYIDGVRMTPRERKEWENKFRYPGDDE